MKKENMIRRELSSELDLCATEYPVLTITGPRQSGKTTLARESFPDLAYFNFELPDVRAVFQADPRGFLAGCSQGAVFDEAQRVPDIFSWLQALVDDDPRPGRFVVTGSEHFGLSEKITQSLAGRTAILELLPFSIRELKRGNYLADSLDDVLWNGAYPPVHHRKMRPGSWYSGYLATYLERDLRQLAAIQDLDLFQRFLVLTAGRVGQLMNTTNLAGDLGVDHKTVSRWLSLLQASYVAVRIAPYHRNFRKRLVKMSKYYFTDTGLVCHLLGIQNPSQLQSHPMRGPIFENWVVAEILKMQRNRGQRQPLTFWRTHDGQDVDLIRERGDRIDLIECKAGQTVMPKMLRPLIRVSKIWEDERLQRWLVYGGNKNMDLHETKIRPWHQIDNLNN
jgi:predicted AAA+ superfamily ATPase